MYRLFLGALLLPSIAWAEDVSVTFTPPDKVPLFDSAKLVDVKGKGGTCKQAAANAVQAAHSKANKKGAPVVLGLFPNHPGKDWTPVTSFACDTSGKKRTVELTALAIHSGNGFPTVTSARAIAIIGQLSHDDPILPTPVGHLQLVTLSGHVFYSLGTEHKDTFPPQVIRTERALACLRTEIEPNLKDWISRVAGIPEITGLRVVDSVSMQEAGNPGQSEQANVSGQDATQGVLAHGESYEYYIPTAAGAAFVSGKLNERQLTDASGIFLSPITKGARLDLSSRASEQISGPSVGLHDQ